MPKVSGLNILDNNIFHNLYVSKMYILYWLIMGPSFLEGGPIMCWSCPSVCLCLSVRLSVPCLHLEGKRKGLQIPNLVGRVSGTPALRGPMSRSRGQRSRSRWLIALLAKNPDNFAACCLINLIFGRWRKDPLPPCTGWPRWHGNGRSVCLSVCLSIVCLHLERKRNGLGRPNLVGRVPGTRAPRGPISKSKHILNCKDGPIAGGPSTAAPSCMSLL